MKTILLTDESSYCVYKDNWRRGGHKDIGVDMRGTDHCYNISSPLFFIPMFGGLSPWFGEIYV